MVRKQKNSKSLPKEGRNQQYVYAILGMLIVFISIIALFNWGIFGMLVLNTFRLFVGQAYDLLLVGVLVFGLAMIVRRAIVNISLWKFLGIFNILIAVSTLLHFIEFHPLEPLADNIFQLTFDIFKNEFITGQNKINIGGGMLGASFYSIFGYLFGKSGTYLLCFMLFFIGLMQLTGIHWDMVIESFKVLFTSIGQFFINIKNTLSEARRSYQDSFVNEEENLSQNIDNHSVTQVDGSRDHLYEEYADIPFESENRSPTLFSRIKNQLFPERKQENHDIWQSSYQPIIEVEPLKEWQEYSQIDPRASKAELERQRIRQEKNLVLDLDYFDQMRVSDKPVSSYTDKEIRLKSEQIDSSLDDNLELENIQEVGESDQTSENDDLTQRANTAEHWKSQSSEIQDVTFDELDEVLKASSKQKTGQTRKNKNQSKEYQLPSKSLLTKIPPVDQTEEYQRINVNIDKLEKTFASFGVDAKVVKANLGPAVTKYEIEPAVGVKVSKIVSLSDDIALALAARDIRMEAPIPGKSLIGIEVPNTQVSPVSFWEVIDPALKSEKILEVPLGRDISGSVCLADLSKMPHLLIAGATGSGKSVGMNVIIVSLLMKAKPHEVKFLMIDPKKVELTMYNELPHLLSPVVTNPRKAAQALNNVVQEMENRYELFAASGVRNLEGYNEYVEKLNNSDNVAYEKLPKIVVFIDELADLMLVASNDVENAIIRLAQMARAAGIHMIIATQRPSVDVITGIIKANVPSRLAFAVSSGTDSRTILDSNGAEKLLGRGDMLFQPMGRSKPLRVQGAYISDNEVENITEFIRNQSEPEYDEDIVVTDEALGMAEASSDEYFDEAVELIRTQETVSISQLQRKFRIGYNRAARLIDDLEAIGYVSEADGSKPRQVLIEDE